MQCYDCQNQSSEASKILVNTKKQPAAVVMDVREKVMITFVLKITVHVKFMPGAAKKLQSVSVRIVGIPGENEFMIRKLTQEKVCLRSL